MPRSLPAELDLPSSRPPRTLLLADAVVCAALTLALDNGWLGLLLTVAWRAGLVLNALVNEWGHLAVACSRGAGRTALTRKNALGSRPLRSHVLALLPFLPDQRGDLVVEIPGLCASETRAVRRHGFQLGAGASGLTVIALLAGSGLESKLACALFAAYTLGAMAALLGAFVTDMTELTHYTRLSGVMACGNVTLLGALLPGEVSAFPERVRSLLEKMVRISQMRGAQSGGAAIQVEQRGEPRQLLQKCLNPKRGDLAKRLDKRLQRVVGRQRAFGGTFLVQAHVRYATAGVCSEHESHPFHFLEARQRGPRRILCQASEGLRPSVRSIETALTHNGDMDALYWRGVRLGYRELRGFLERVLGVQCRWRGDSPMLAGVVELFLTQGMWLESLRLAYHLVLAPPPPDPNLLANDLDEHERERALGRALAEYPAPSPRVLEHWAWVAEQIGSLVWARSADFAGIGQVRGQLAERLTVGLREHGLSRVSPERLREFAETAVDAFLHNGLYDAVRRFEPLVEGTMGCVITSALEPGRAVVVARGQPISLGFRQRDALVAIVSERNALKVLDAKGQPVLDERLDLELGQGEIALVEAREHEPVRLMVYSIARQQEQTHVELHASGRIIQLKDNPYVLPLPHEVRDRTARDIEDIASVVENIRGSWRQLGSGNTWSARAFAEALFTRSAPRLLVVGITNDLWISEQFVKNLKTLFPDFSAEARSSNAVLADFERLTLDENSVVLVVSQSGQDFPTLGCLLLLKQRLERCNNDSLFVLSSELDTLMGQVMGQGYAKEARFCGRIFSNQSGFRPSEAATLSVNATHHTFVELLLYLAARAQECAKRFQAPHGFRLTRRELDALRERRNVSVDSNVPRVTRRSDADRSARVADQFSAALTRHARRWTWHVLEGVVAFMAAVLVLEVNLQFRLGLEPSGVFELLSHAVPWADASTPSWLHVLGTQMNVVFYALLGPISIWCIRCVQRRPALHRQGTRELIIGDTRYVHRVVWLLARRVFSLSYGFASIKPYAADSQDDLVLTHEPVRGSLALFGVPDARRAHLRERSGAALMTAKQFANSRSVGGAGAEVVVIGHGPVDRHEAGQTFVSLPSAAPRELSPDFDVLVEDMFDSWERMLTMQVFINDVSERVSRFGPFSYDRSRTKDQVFAPTTAAPVSAAMVYALLARASEPARLRVPTPAAISANSHQAYLVTHSLERTLRLSTPRRLLAGSAHGSANLVSNGPPSSPRRSRTDMIRTLRGIRP